MVEFVGALREHGTGIGTGETVDAAAAVDLPGDREQVRVALKATMLRCAESLSTFHAMFDLCFPAASGDTDSAAEQMELTDLRDELVAALADGDP